MSKKKDTLWQKKLAIYYFILTALVIVCLVILSLSLNIETVNTVFSLAALFIAFTDLTVAVFLFARHLELKGKKISILFNVLGFFMAFVVVLSTVIELVQWRL